MNSEVYSELINSHGQDPYKTLAESIQNSSQVWYFPNEQEPKAIFGIVPLDIINGIASPWLITFDGLSPKDLLKYTKPILHIMLDYWPVLINYVDASFDKAIRWAEWAGFTVNDATPYGPYRKPFKMITMGKE